MLGTVMASTALSGAAATFVGPRDDFRDETIYFAMTTRFYDGDPANNTQCWDNQDKNAGDPAWRGDFKGLIEKLDYIKALGFTAIWITPVVENASGYDYHGYHASNFSRVDHRYESADITLQTLIDAVHAKGMKLIIDIVLNHTGNFGEENLCKTVTLTYTYAPADAQAFEVEWSSSDTSVATVTNKGKVKGIAPGTAVITVAVKGNPAVKATCTVNVVLPWGDLNEDGRTNVSDVQKLVNHILIQYPPLIPV